MFVIVVYDINWKRVEKALKICKKYLVHVQKSVFEGNITEGQLKQLKNEMFHLIKIDEDSVCIYRFEFPKYAKKEEIGTIERRCIPISKWLRKEYESFRDILLKIKNTSLINIARYNDLEVNRWKYVKKSVYLWSIENTGENGILGSEKQGNPWKISKILPKSLSTDGEILIFEKNLDFIRKNGDNKK